ncbi:hypothetical protein DSL72_000217 [Monilinia vaccinii-corymbosi]|uniref:Gfd2/YDR514C-like C-terminal domain-containing protein n=1 Tax=Monilinia vaccinii-corymbosi TaxID=61207 RepID=A0A8A3P9E1_9HELO|nr:hypothetical protein DSL72_000217 [Monilinia vaccinii-corymbosi]
MADRIDRLRALTGQQDVYDITDLEETQADETEEPFVLPEGFKIRARHVYEGTSEQEDDAPPSSAQAQESMKAKHRGNALETQWGEDSNWDDGENMTARMRAGTHQSLHGSSAPLLYPELGTNDFLEYKGLEYGQLAAPGESFCPWKTVTQYPNRYVGNANRFKVAERFFTGGKCYLQTWDFFYLYRLEEDPNQSPIILVPTRQVEHFLAVINRTLGTNLTIPSGSKGAFDAVFNSDGTPYPRYLGRVLNKNMADELRENVPPRYYKLDGEPPITKPPVDMSLEAFRRKIDALNATAKNKKAANKEKQRADRISKQQAWKDSTKRVQRYLGLRKRSDSSTSGSGNSADVNTFYDPEQPTKFPMEDAIVFVCIDVEAYELNNNIITEIGIATLDVLDIAGMEPGVLGANWRKAIRARHFRIKEHMHLNNSKHVQGCADRFEFGKSEIISRDDAPHVVGSCFKYPFSSPSPSAELANEKRNIILVGHDVDADIRFLRQIGYEINNLKLHEGCDTTLMWRALKRESNPRSLAAILAEIGIAAWNLHNAGNDAVYTLQAMLGIACKHLVDRKMERKEKDKLKKDRISKSMREAAELACEHEEGWSSDGSDGGDRITAEQAVAKKTADAAKKAVTRRPKVTDVDQLWRYGSAPAPTPAPATSSPWNSRPVAQGPSQAQKGWGTPPETPTNTAKATLESALTPEPALIHAEQFGYSSGYQSPAPPTYDPSGRMNTTSSRSAAEPHAPPRDQGTSETRTGTGGSDWGRDWARRSTPTVSAPVFSTLATTTTSATSTSIDPASVSTPPVPTDQFSTAAVSPTSIGMTGLERPMQNATLAEFQAHGGGVPRDLPENASSLELEEQREEQDFMVTKTLADTESPWPDDPRRKLPVKW